MAHHISSKKITPLHFKAGCQENVSLQSQNWQKSLENPLPRMQQSIIPIQYQLCQCNTGFGKVSYAFGFFLQKNEEGNAQNSSGDEIRMAEGELSVLPVPLVLSYHTTQSIKVQQGDRTQIFSILLNMLCESTIAYALRLFLSGRRERKLNFSYA